MSHKLKQVAMLLASSMMLVTSAANADAQVPATAVADAPHAEHYVAPHIPHDEFQTIKLVVPVTTDAPDVVGMKLRNIQNGIIVPSGFLEVALLQQHKGYSVDPAN
jgi:hypothetical protein